MTSRLWGRVRSRGQEGQYEPKGRGMWLKNTLKKYAVIQCINGLYNVLKSQQRRKKIRKDCKMMGRNVVRTRGNAILKTH